MKKIIFGSLIAYLTIGLLSITLPVEASTKLHPIVKDNFDSYINGSILGQGSWTNYANGQNFIVESSLAFKHGKALHNNALADSVITKTGASLSDGRQTVYIRSENMSQWGSYPDGNAQVRLSKGQSFASSIFVATTFKSDGNVAYYDSVADVYRNFATYQDNKWTRLDIEWRSSDKTARYRVNNGTWTNWLTFRNAASFTDFDNVGLDFVLPSGSGGIYFDALR